MRFFCFPRSPYTAKVLVSAYEKGVSFSEVEHVPPYDPAAMARMRTEERQPLATVPLLRLDDGTYLQDSTSIVDYLELSHPGTRRVIPADPGQALRVRALDRFAEHLIVATNYVTFALRAPSRNEKKLAASQTTLSTALDLYEKMLEDRAFLVTDEPTLADVSPAAAIGVILRPGDGIDTHALDHRPRVRRWFDRIAGRSSWQRLLEDIEKTARPF